ncbi:hypothetical protein QLS71_010295 [Mariniflexile litorale]|uniref:Lipoprotein n=1 Tax=Mariniflexile litorale TaxID=3045158 RepID=A0AAU7EC35_9FLAO|nr:hypothetical protein [Mariniflexile sp. KMM 9835]MDQ8213382.1 hypothetical protein [Mariniflexile sp. KMM 9835]
MNRFFSFVVLVISIMLTGCQFSENIYINEDGTGKMEFSFDGTQLMQMAGDKISESQEKAIDSTFSFKELFHTMRDSISKLSEEEQQKLKSLEPFKMHMVMNPETSQMKFDMFTDFNKVSELQDMFKAMKNFGDMKGKEKATTSSNPFSSFGGDGSTELDYKYDGKRFKRTAKIIDKEAYKQVTDSLGQMAMMFGSSTYKLNYHFPKRIKSVSNETAMFSNDRKSVTIEYGFMDYLSNPEALNLEVILED